jgi:WD40 repeat protein
VAFSSDNRYVVTAGHDGTLRAWHVRVEDLLVHARRVAGRELTPHERELYSLPPAGTNPKR